MSDNVHFTAVNVCVIDGDHKAHSINVFKLEGQEAEIGRAQGDVTLLVRRLRMMADLIESEQDVK